MNCLYCKSDCYLKNNNSIFDTWICDNHKSCRVSYYYKEIDIQLISFDLKEYAIDVDLKDKETDIYRSINDNQEYVVTLPYVPSNLTPENIENKIKMFLAFQ